MTQTLDNKVRRRLRLAEIERLIVRHSIISPPPARRTLVAYCDDGTFETVGDRPTPYGWLVYEDSFWRWAASVGFNLTAAGSPAKRP